MATGTVPCPGSWEPLWCCKLPTQQDHPDVDVEELIEQAVTAAAEVLYSFTGQRFGLCELTLRPCRRDCWDRSWPGFGDGWWEWTTGGVWPRPALIGGAWFNLVCAGCPGGCSCSPLSEALLPGPVHAITQVKLDGQVLTEGVDYRLDESRRLVRLGGHWPICQHMDRDDDQQGTWSVTAQFGEELPTSGRMALGELACAFLDACLGEDCPPALRPVQQLVRQGVSLTFLDPNRVFASGRTGLTHVDLFISAFNRHRLPSAPQVFDVDGPSFRMVG